MAIGTVHGRVSFYSFFDFGPKMDCFKAFKLAKVLVTCYNNFKHNC